MAQIYCGNIYSHLSERDIMAKRLAHVLRDAAQDSIPPRAIAWVRQWIAESDEEDLADWTLYALEGIGLRLERYTRERDDSVVVEADTLAFHWMCHGMDWAAWIVVGIDSPHVVLECEIGEGG